MNKILILFLTASFLSDGARAQIKDATRDRILLSCYVYKRLVHTKGPFYAVYICRDFDLAGDSDLCFENRLCARCSFLRKDSVMNDFFYKIISSYAASKNKIKALLSNQQAWIKKRNRIAAKESKQFRGETHEMIAFDKSLTDETDKRTQFLLDKYKLK